MQSKAMASLRGQDKTYRNLIKAFAYWAKMNADLREYVKTSPNCQKVDPTFHKASGKLHSVPVPKKFGTRWESICVSWFQQTGIHWISCLCGLL